MEPIDLVFEPLPGADLVRLVEENVVNHTINVTGAIEWFPTNVFLRSSSGDWVGGCLGVTWAGWLHIRFLWVTERMRGQGLGTRLMDAAEGHAMELGASSATLDTLNPEALRFYRGRGYRVFGTLDDFPPGHARYFLRKALVPPLGETPL